MEKKGEITLAMIGVGIIISALVIGAINLSEERSSRNLKYIGDKETKLVYDPTKCDVSHISNDNMVFFDSLKEAEEKGFNKYSC
ncbi:MAG: hypothetical protein ISS82_01525 [Nanoarchaeota archaeon]|nr:hypothetical protein [Nanoarchaeota archaeon]